MTETTTLQIRVKIAKYDKIKDGLQTIKNDRHLKSVGELLEKIVDDYGKGKSELL